MQQQVLQAIHTLYNHPDPEVKKQTSSQLEHWQQSEDAWSVSDAVLHDPRSSMEAQYFCAQTLRTKVQRDFEELPSSAAEALRSSLLELLLRFADGALPVRTQLCLAIAAMAAHVPSQQWAGGGVVRWLAENVGRQRQDIALPCMLELLTVLPEEVGSYRPAVRPQRRRQMQEEVIAEVPLALQVLASCLQAKGDQVQGRVLSAFAAWLRLSAGAGLGGPTLASHPLTQAAMEGLKSMDTFEDASDAVCELVMCTASRGQPEPQMMPLVALLVPAVMGLRQRFAVAARSAQAEKDQQPVADDPQHDEDDDEDSVKGMARLFAELGEAYTALIATATPDSMQPVQALLEVAAYPNQAISAISFNFWHRLMRHLTSGFSSSEDPQQPQSETAQFDEQQRRLDAFKPAYQRLVGIITQHMEYPSDYLQWHQDELDDFRHNRMSLAETLEDAADVLGWQQTLQQLLQPLQQMAGTFDWRVAEAALYCIRSISRQNIAAGEPLLMSLFGSLPSMPRQEGPLQCTLALMIGSYSNWLAATLRVNAQGQALVSQLLHLLMQTLDQRESCAAAASSIRHICYDCGPFLAASHLDALVQLYQKVQGQGAVAPQGTSHLREKDVQQVTEAVVSVAASLEGPAQQTTSQAMLQPVLQSLQHRLQQPLQQQQQKQQTNSAASVQTPDAAEIISALMDRLGVLFRKMSSASLTATNLAHSWPLLAQTLTLYSSNERVSEKTGRAITHGLQASGKASVQLLPQVLEAVASQFKQSQHPCMLYIASELLKTYGADAQYQAALGQLFATIVGQALQGLQQLADFDSHPDMADDTFLLISRAVRYSPGVVLNAHMLPLILQASMAGVLVQHREACCSILAVLRRLHDPEFLQSCSQAESQALQAALPPHDPMLVRILLGGVAGALPKSRVDDISDVLFNMLQATKGVGHSWLAAALSLLPEHAASETDKQSILTTAQTTASGENNKGRFEDVVDDLSEVCRRNRHSMDAAIQCLLPAQLYQAIQPK